MGMKTRQTPLFTPLSRPRGDLLVMSTSCCALSVFTVIV